jgi:hypothetical protein
MRSMSRSVFSRFSCAGLLAFSAAMVGGQKNRLLADIYNPNPIRSFTLPADSNSSSVGSLFGALPSGQLLVLNESQILKETAVNSGVFSPVGTIANFTPSFGPSFLSVSPDGTHAAAGSNGAGYITVFNPATPATATNFTVAGDFDSKWINNNLLAISDSSGVQILNTSNGSLKTVISDVGGASGGITVDSVGNLYTGDGFYFGGGASETGLIKEFSNASWNSALTSGTPLDFQANGAAVAKLLSADSLAFDNGGNLFVGGGDFFGSSGDFGYSAIVASSAIQAELSSPSSMPKVDMNSTAALQKILSPQSFIDDFDYGLWTYNPATSEAYLRYFGDSNVQAIAVPEPASMALLGLGCGMLILRRRKNSPRDTGLRPVRIDSAVQTMSASRRNHHGPEARVSTVLLALAAMSILPEFARADYTYNPVDFATAVISSTVTGSNPAYSDPTAILGQPAPVFNNSSNPNVIDSRLTKIIEAPVNYDLSGNPVITELPNTPNTTQITAQMGRPISHAPSHPYGDDLIVFGNSFFLGGGAVDDTTNLNSLTLSGGIYSHPVQVSVSPDNVIWFSFPVTAGLQPYNAYKWDDANADWTSEELNPTVPLNPSVYTTNFAGDTAAQVLDAYGNSAGGTGFDLQNAVDSNGMTLQQDGFNSIDYVRVASTTSSYAVISGISAVSSSMTATAFPEPSGAAAMAVGGLSLLCRHPSKRMHHGPISAE